jgi:UDP-GlcNAc:undecaprenyl-phosphate GlcNAc-1-phosphate transferase
MAIISILSVLFSLILGLIFTPLIRALLLRRKAFKKNHQQKEFIPYPGGLSVFFSFFIVSLVIAIYSGYLDCAFAAVITGSVIIVLIGLLDDLVELVPGAKFLGQTLAVIPLVFFGVHTEIAGIPLAGNLLVTFFWMFAIINAFNLLDILDGLCCGVAVIASAAFLLLAIISGNVLASILCGSLLGAGLGFLKYNLPPAKIYPGDTGSMLFGFVLGSLAIIVDYAPLNREIALLTPVLILGLPVFDTAFVILMRFLHGRPVVEKSKDHFALRLIEAGWSKQKALLFMYIFASLFAGSALIISRVSNQQGIIVLFIIILICAIALKKTGSIKING